MIRAQPRPGFCRPTRHVKDVFDADGNSGQSPNRAALSESLLDSPCLLQGAVTIDQLPGRNLGLALVDLIQARFHQLDGRQRPRTQLHPDLRQRWKICCHGFSFNALKKPLRNLCEMGEKLVFWGPFAE